jgi:hypothetical protein
MEEDFSIEKEVMEELEAVNKRLKAYCALPEQGIGDK